MNFVELLAPARDLQSAVAAVDYGADAVYIGGAKFGARHAAGNSAEQIARVAEYAHRYGVRVHATLNTLIYDDELETAERQARELIAAGVDALIVQDMALRRMDLPVELHASTQVCNMTPEQARFLGECGFARVILDRAHTLAAGDGICFLTPRGLVGTNVNAADGDCVTPNRMEGIAPGCEVYRNYDHRFNQLLERSRTRRVIPAAVVVTASAEGVTFRYTDCEGVAAVAERRVALEPANNAEANAAALRTQAMKSGDTIFAVRSAEVQGAEWFVPASLASQLRREGLAALLQARLARGVEHRILPEGAAEYPSETLSAEENVTNRLAEAFYRDHGVRQIERGLDLAATTAGRRVMRSAYCIRREIGECLKERPRLKGDLWLERGANRYRLEFDCVRCEMSLVDCTRKETAKPKPKP